MAQVNTVVLAKPKNKKDYVIVNRDNNEKQIAEFKALGFTEEISLDDNAKSPDGAK